MTAPKFTPVTSSNIAGVHYNDATKAMTVQFKSGAHHRYEDVPPEHHSKMMAAKSVGKYFHANIRHAFKSHPVEEQSS